MIFRGAVVGAVSILSLGLWSEASAQTLAIDRSLTIQAHPVFGTGGLDPVGDEVVVRIENATLVPRHGTITVTKEGWGRPLPLAEAPFTVDPSGSATVHFPVQTDQSVDIAVTEEGGQLRFTTRISSLATGALSIVDATDPSRLMSALAGAQVDPDYHVSESGVPTVPLEVLALHTDRDSGDPIFPRYVSGWRTVDLALIDSGVLSRLGGAELESLVAYVLGGGELGVVVSHTEDLKQPTLRAFVGGEARLASPDQATTEPIYLMQTPSAGTPAWSMPPNAPSDGVELRGFVGGNLSAVPAGSASTYGLGEVVLLAFDPTRPETARDPWVSYRMIDLARRGYERKSASVFGVSASNRGRTYLYSDYYQEVRKQLDPNQSARWAIGVATAILCLYAVIAGPIAFWFFKRRRTPLRALAALPIISLVVFFMVVGVGFISKGATSRARRLTFIDAGAGMGLGVAQRYRAYFSASSRELTITPSQRTSVLRSELADTNPDSDSEEIIGVSRDGARLERVPAVPWQTLLVREQGLASIGDGISIVESTGDNLVIKNRSGRTMKAVIIKLPNDEVRFVSRIEDGQTIDTRDLPGNVLRTWSATSLSTIRVGRADVHELKSAFLRDELLEFPDVVDAWRAAESTTPNTLDWFPRALPVVLAELDGGKGPTSDSGMAIDSDRTLVRVVGWGGEP